MNVSLKSAGSLAVLTVVPGSSLHQHVQGLPEPGWGEGTQTRE